MNTPWGRAQSQRTICKGVTWVSTAGHGGLLIGTGVAKELLTPAAIKRGDEYGAYLAYEEDCACSIPFYENPQWMLDLGLTDYNYETKESRPFESAEAARADAWKSISGWNADYLIERGIEPEPTRYAAYLEIEENDRLRREKHPDLVVCAKGLKGGIVELSTADGEKHYVTAASYDNRVGVNLLSKYERVPAPNQEMEDRK